MRGTETITRHRAGGRDADGDPLPAEPDLPIPHCIVTPRTSDEEGEGTVIVEGFNVFAPNPSDVTANDEVTVRGERFDVIGTPADLRNARGRRKALWIVLGRRGT